QNIDSPIAAFLQLRKAFSKKDRVFGYKRQELVAHEIAHVGRMVFNEPKFEEFFACWAMGSRFRRWFGPIFQTSGESFALVALLLLCSGLDWFSTLLQGPDWTKWILLLPSVLILLFLGRLGWRHYQLYGCRRQLKAIFGEQADHVAYR